MNSTASLKAQFDLHTRLFNNATAGISDGESNTRNDDHVNHVKWIAGHLLNTRLGSFSKVAGLQPDDIYAAQFGRGNSLDVNASYPSLDEIRNKWNQVSAGISNGINNIPDTVLQAPSNAQVPIADTTVNGLVSFLVSHEAYHIGQLGILRKLMGKEAMSYN